MSFLKKSFDFTILLLCMPTYILLAVFIRTIYLQIPFETSSFINRSKVFITNIICDLLICKEERNLRLNLIFANRAWVETSSLFYKIKAILLI